MTKYHLGVAVKPDSSEAIVGGMRQLMYESITPDWEGYESAASWDLNAKSVLYAAGFTGKTES